MRNTYYYRRFVRIRTNEEAKQRAIDSAIGDATTFVYCPITVTHDFYEDDRVREACGLYKADGIDVRNILQVGTKPKNLTLVLGRINLTIQAVSNRDTQIKVRCALYFSRVTTSVDAVADSILRASPIQHNGEAWNVLACTGGRERVRFVATPNPNNNNTGSGAGAGVREGVRETLLSGGGAQ